MVAIGYKNGQPTGLQIDKPSITQADANDYRNSIDYLLLEDDTQIEPTPADPVTDVERAATLLAARRQAREDVIFSDTAGLVATCYAWLQRECRTPLGGKESKSASQALQAGQGLCSTYGNQLRLWIDFAAPDFYQAMSKPDEARAWLEWMPTGEPKSIREAILDRVYLATYGVARK